MRSGREKELADSLQRKYEICSAAGKNTVSLFLGDVRDLINILTFDKSKYEKSK